MLSVLHKNKYLWSFLVILKLNTGIGSYCPNIRGMCIFIWILGGFFFFFQFSDQMWNLASVLKLPVIAFNGAANRGNPPAGVQASAFASVKAPLGSVNILTSSYLGLQNHLRLCCRDDERRRIWVVWLKDNRAGLTSLSFQKHRVASPLQELEAECISDKSKSIDLYLKVFKREKHGSMNMHCNVFRFFKWTKSVASYMVSMYLNRLISRSALTVY